MNNTFPQFDVRLTIMIGAGTDDHVFAKRITLPFAPYPGLVIFDDDASDHPLTVENVVWSTVRNAFDVDLESTVWPEDPRPEMESLGWTDCNCDDMP